MGDIGQAVECSPSIHDTVAHTVPVLAWEVQHKASEAQVHLQLHIGHRRVSWQGHLWLCRRLGTYLGYMRPCLKKLKRLKRLTQLYAMLI